MKLSTELKLTSKLIESSEILHAFFLGATPLVVPILKTQRGQNDPLPTRSCSELGVFLFVKPDIAPYCVLQSYDISGIFGEKFSSCDLTQVVT